MFSCKSNASCVHTGYRLSIYHRLKTFRLKKVTIGDPHAAEFIVVVVGVARSVWVTTNEVGDGVKSGDLLPLLMTRETEGGRTCEVCLQSLRSWD